MKIVGLLLTMIFLLCASACGAKIQPEINQMDVKTDDSRPEPAKPSTSPDIKKTLTPFLNKPTKEPIEKVENKAGALTEVKVLKPNIFLHTDDGLYILPNSDKKRLMPEDLILLEGYTLKLAKNEIFARHGYVFNDQQLYDYFKLMKWYKEDSSFKGAVDELSEIEKSNVLLLDDWYKNGTNYYDKYQDIKQNYVVQIDLNGDGKTEEIHILNDGHVAWNCYQITVSGIGGDYLTEENKLYGELFLADFSISDPSVQFYTFENGTNNGRPVYLTVYKLLGNTCKELISDSFYPYENYDNTSFVSAVDMQNEVVYDGGGKLFISSYHMLNYITRAQYWGYYDVDKEMNIVYDLRGQIIQYKLDVPLFGDAQKCVYLGSMEAPDSPSGFNLYGNLVTIVKAKEALNIINVDYADDRVILNLQTKDNITGFLDNYIFLTDMAS